MFHLTCHVPFDIVKLVAGTAKDLLRADLIARRRAVPDQVRRAESVALCGHVSKLLGSPGEPAVVAAYAPLGTEPGSDQLLATLTAHCARVLLPIARKSADGVPMPLQWAAYRADALVDAPFGLREPPQPWLPPSELATARTIFVPALAVDRRGARLGRGAGFYDRSLHVADPEALVIAIVRDEELVDALPADPHDVPMTHALTPAHGLVTLG